MITDDRAVPRITRRRLLQLGAVGVAAAAGSLLVACGGESSDGAPAANVTSEGGSTGSTSGTTVPSGTDGTPGSSDSGEGQDEQGRYGGVFKAATATPPPSLDVAINVTAASREATLFFLETLVTYSEDYQVIPMLAEKWDSSEDGTTYTFTLREGVKFHNGKEMTSEDVVASFTRFLDVAVRKTSFDMIESFEATGPYTVDFHLKYPSPAVLDAIAYPAGYCGIYPAEIIEGKGADQLQDTDHIGTGPYRLVEWKPDQYVKLQRFDDYQPLPGERNGLGGAKIPYFDEIQLIPVPETAARIAGLQTGEYDYAASPATTDYDVLNDNPDTTPYIIEDSTWVVLLFNFRNPISSNLKFRQAVQAALDHEALAQAITNGRSDFYRLQPSLWFPVSPFYTEIRAELYNQNDPEKAKQLLEEAGYNGEEIVLVTNRNYDYMYKVIVTAEQQLKNIGMNTRVDVIDWPAQQARWTEGDWQISTTGYLSQALFAPDAFGAFYGGGGGDAGAGYNNPEMTQAFENAARATTLEERKAAFVEVQRIFYDDVAGIKVCDIYALTSLRSEIKGYTPWYNTTRFWGCWRET